MAIDTAAKRAAALQAGLTPGIVLPIPDGTVDAADRAQLAGAYAISGDVTVAVVAHRVVAMRGRASTVSFR